MRGRGIIDLKKLTADHIGPISLGFAHIPKFQPFCKHHNNTKNNRFSYDDVQKLIDLEGNTIDYYLKERHEIRFEKTEHLIIPSWHSKYIWDSMKDEITNNNDALKLSKAMRWSHHYFLEMFFRISDNGNKDALLQYLNPQHAFYGKIEFKNPNPLTFEHQGIIREIGTRTEHYRNAARYLRIAFVGLKQYHAKTNRKIPTFIIQDANDLMTGYFNDISSHMESGWEYDHELRQSLEGIFSNIEEKRIDSLLKTEIIPQEFWNSNNNNNELTSILQEYLVEIGDIMIENWDSL